jgi:hypothetical protein
MQAVAQPARPRLAHVPDPFDAPVAVGESLARLAPAQDERNVQGDGSASVAQVADRVGEERDAVREIEDDDLNECGS